MFGDAKKIYGAVAPAIQDLVPQQMQGPLDNLRGGVMKAVQGYENIRNKIDDVENQAVSKVGDIMSKIGGVQKQLQGQGYNFNFV